jgi:hypothetical protein
MLDRTLFETATGGQETCAGGATLPNLHRSTKPERPKFSLETSMLFRPLPIFLTLALLAGATGLPVTSAFANDIWQVKTSGSFVTLRYGPLNERERAPFLLSCLNGVGIAVLSVNMDFPEMETGEALTIEFSAGDKTAPVAGETAAEDGTGIIYGEAGDIAVKPILKVLEQKGPVTMKSGANAMELSDVGRAENVAEFAKECSLD